MTGESTPSGNVIKNYELESSKLGMFSMQIITLGLLAVMQILTMLDINLHTLLE